MAERLKVLTDEARATLSNITIADGVLRLPPERLDRKVYVEVADALSRLGGKWVGKKVQGFTFEDNEDPRGTLREMLESGFMPPKNPFDFFYTPPEVARRVVELADLLPASVRHLHVLEPSAGVGHLVGAVLELNPTVQLTMVELDAGRRALLQAMYPNQTVWAGDFLELSWAGVMFDRVVMNPPFRTPGRPVVYIDHVRRAFAELRPGGILVAVVPQGFIFRTDKACSSFREWVDAYGGWMPLAPGAFKESGTGVNVALVRMVKPW